MGDHRRSCLTADSLHLWFLTCDNSFIHRCPSDRLKEKDAFTLPTCPFANHLYYVCKCDKYGLKKRTGKDNWIKGKAFLCSGGLFSHAAFTSCGLKKLFLLFLWLMNWFLSYIPPKKQQQKNYKQGTIIYHFLLNWWCISFIPSYFIWSNLIYITSTKTEGCHMMSR